MAFARPIKIQDVLRLNSVNVKKGRIWFVVISHSVNVSTWIMFLVYFGRMDPVIRGTVMNDKTLYAYGLITVPFWIYSFLVPLLHPIIAANMLIGGCKLDVLSQAASGVLALNLGCLLNSTSSIMHVVRHLDNNKHTVKIVIVGLVAVCVATVNLVIMQIAILMYKWVKWNATSKQGPQFQVTPVTPGASFNRPSYNEYPQQQYQQETSLQPPSRTKQGKLKSQPPYSDFSSAGPTAPPISGLNQPRFNTQTKKNRPPKNTQNLSSGHIGFRN